MSLVQENKCRVRLDSYRRISERSCMYKKWDMALSVGLTAGPLEKTDMSIQRQNGGKEGVKESRYFSSPTGGDVWVSGMHS